MKHLLLLSLAVMLLDCDVREVAHTEYWQECDCNANFRYIVIDEDFGVEIYARHFSQWCPTTTPNFSEKQWADEYVALHLPPGNRKHWKNRYNNTIKLGETQ